MVIDTPALPTISTFKPLPWQSAPVLSMKKAWNAFRIGCGKNHKILTAAELISTRGTCPELNLGAIFVGKMTSLKNFITAPGSDFEIYSGRKAHHGGVCGWIGR